MFVQSGTDAPGTKDTLSDSVSFRRRLTVFFALIVLVPMITVAILLVQLNSESRAGKADARLAANLQVALASYGEGIGDARRAVNRLAEQSGAGQALRRGDPDVARAFAERARARHDLAAIVLSDASGSELARAGDGVAFATMTLRQGERVLGSLATSTTTADSYLEQVQRLTDDAAVLLRGDQAVASVGTTAAGLPREGDAEIEGQEVRVRSATISDPELTLSLIAPRESEGLTGSDPLVGILLLGFFAIALAFIIPLLRDLGSLHERVAEQAVTDELTGLSNPRRFRELLGKEVERSMRFGHPLSLLLIDIDDFKRVNDSHGHPQGDAVLQAVARVLGSEAREVDEPARYGGEEFALVLPETEARGAGELAERIRARVEGTRVPLRRGGAVSVTASVGVASTSDGVPVDANRLFAAADQALYAAKRAGKNRTERRVRAATGA